MYYFSIYNHHAVKQRGVQVVYYCSTVSQQGDKTIEILVCCTTINVFVCNINRIPT